VVDDIGRAIRHREYTKCNNNRCRKAIEVCEGHERKADPSRHHHHVHQRVANGHIAVIGHHGQHVNLSYNKKQESSQLGGTFIV
jgi:hypothetical protein